MRIPIIILNYNSSGDCRKCIGFLRQQEGVETEIVVVDNLSPRPGEQDAIRRLCHEQGCTFIQARDNQGYNAGNNIGLRYAAQKGYKYALIANPDMEFPQRDYIRRMAEAMEGRPEVAVVGTDIVGPEGVHQNPMKRDGSWRTSWNWIGGVLHRHRKTESYDFIDCYSESHYCAKVSGCCLMVKLDVMKRIGFFDEGVFLYCEEAILSRQVERASLRMYYMADSQAIHAHVKSEKGNPVPRFRNWKRSRFYFIDKYSDYSFFGRCVAKLSMQTYVALTTFIFKIKNHGKKEGKIS